MTSTNIQDYKIATMGSHTALQILKGAKDEGFQTLCVVTPKTRPVYEHYGMVDEFIEIDHYKNFCEIEQQLIDKNCIAIPHGSFVSYLGHECMKNLKCMHYGTKGILEWESDRAMERKWLLKAGLKLPKIFKSPEEIDRAVIIKFHGAKGGSGYFIANNPKEFYEGLAKYGRDDDYVIQEYIVGVPMYVHYFYSPLTKELEIMSFDKRYESNADSIGRIAARDQLAADIQTSYTITGNIPLVVRESLLPMLYEMGENTVKTSQDLVGKGLFGPFCLEGIMDTNLNFYVFEISARIVAGTNPFINGSPYTALRYDEPMSTGRRMARDIKQGIESGQLDKILG
ncbi:formate--phosphoribosylaminoimidazolecarboxamide ligase [Candidatus Peregrinibacteria bacterium]|jgi:5-formaminoimidazole-4-carboxamide-1-(beta)-D-ribofuranosyl 5'-monophosphate synthetase|nr:formate--phosphoribosylaminoimidazolecarboxamide ligase [Candidatus Peregrinibacteria bacterium]MBT7703398.1 formate--phosphoribosylaminoimidazolecarboxamide ligase [Candidatus Peregrinibacteria bacterium]